MGWTFRLAVVSTMIVVMASGCTSKQIRTTDRHKRTFRVIEVLDGEWSGKTLTVTDHPFVNGVRIMEIDSYPAPPLPTNPEAIQMVLAFQLAPGKTRSDFAKFKQLDFPWVTRNHGSNGATIWTARDEKWPFDAFEDVVFASKADFEKAYAGTPELAKAGEGLFGDKVFVAIVREEE